MAWGVFYRPETEWRGRFHLDQPHFKAFPLDTALLSDPAFSSDPRNHPHFHADSRSTRPPKASPRQPSQISRKAGMKALVRRLTSHHYLDRIDELDETDPFGANHHHDGPYEAIGNTHVQPTIHTNTVSRSPNTHHPKRAFNPCSLHPTHYQSTPRVPSVHGEMGLSLHLEPGQILQHNTIYTSHISTITSAPSHPAPQSNTLATIPKPDHARSHSLTNSQPHSPRHSFAHPLGDLRNRPSSFPRASSQRYPGGNTLNIPDVLSPHHNSDVASHLPSQTEMTVFSPPRYESRLHGSVLSQSPQPAMLFSTARKTQAIESSIPALPPNRAERKYVPSLDSSHTTNSLTQSSSSIQHQSLEPPRIRHLPKRLVMPAPLQPQPTLPQPQYEFPLAKHMVWQNGYPEDRAPDGPDSDGQFVIHSQGPRLLRKKSSAFPEKMPIPYYVPMFQDDATPKIGTIPANTENETERTKEKIRRRRLSKRKSD